MGPGSGAGSGPKRIDSGGPNSSIYAAYTLVDSCGGGRIREILPAPVSGLVLASGRGERLADPVPGRYRLEAARKITDRLLVTEPTI